jgi:hypothetical protein
MEDWCFWVAGVGKLGFPKWFRDPDLEGGRQIPDLA